MAADNVTSIQQMEDQVRAGYADMARFHKGNVEAVMASSQAMISGCQAMHAALLAFMQSRAKEGLATGKSLAECGSPERAIEIQLDFARTALQAYADQFNQVGKLAGQVLDDCLTPFRRRVDAVAERGTDSLAA